MIKSKIQTDDKISVNINHFYNIYKKEKRPEYPSLFSFNKKTRKVNFVEFKLIVKTFLTIYFKELYFLKKPKPFFFGGYLKLVIYNKWIHKQKVPYKNEYKHSQNNNAVGLFWYLRPSRYFYKRLKLIKLTGKYNALPKIEKTIKQNEDIDNIPIFINEKRRLKKEKQLYRYVFTDSSI